MNKYDHLLQTGNKFILLIFLLATVLILGGCGAQAAPKVYRVGVLNGLDYFGATVDGFKAKMTELGYKEGQNISYDVQKTAVDPAEYQRVLKKFVTDQADLIFVFPTEATQEAKAVTQGTNIPVVFANAVVEGTNIIDNIRQPGGNITGVRFPAADLSLKRLEILHQIAPQAKRIWVTYLKDYPIVPPQLEVLRPAAESMGITLVEVPATSPADVQADLQARATANNLGLDAIVFMAEPLALTPDVFTMIRKFAADHKVPIGGVLVAEGDQGTMFNYVPDNLEEGGLAAALADKIFKGTSAGTIPVVSPESHLQINYKMTKELGLTVPEGLLSQADEIIR